MSGSNANQGERTEQTTSLSLKNLYRMLSMRDYPVYSIPVLNENRKTGQTLVKFWQTFFARIFPSSVDMSIFQLEGGRMRQLSTLMNARGGKGFRQEWFQSLSRQITAELLLKMCLVWTEILKSNNYSSESLDLRLVAFWNAVREDEALPGHAVQMMDRLIAAHTEILQETPEETSLSRQFSQVHLLSWMTLYALYGVHMNDEALDRLRVFKDAAPHVLQQSYLKAVHPNRVTVLTKMGNLVSGSSGAEMLAREDLLNSGMEILQACGKLLITGIGGIGKTVLAMQLMKRMNERGSYSRIAVVTYTVDLPTSLAQAFVKLHADTADAIREKCRGQLESKSTDRSLLVVDDVPARLSGRALRDIESLSDWDCDIILTSRLSAVKGFESLSVQPMDEAASRALFHRAYEYDLTGQEEDVQALLYFLQGHPLSIALFARLCRVRFWTVGQLNKRLFGMGLRQIPAPVASREEEPAQVYRRIFDSTSMSDKEIQALRLMSAFPSLPLKPRELLPYAGDVTQNEDDLTNVLQVLCDQGWLTRGRQGYQMHPMIAETMRMDGFACRDLPNLWRYAAQMAEDQQRMEENRALLTEMLSRVTELNADGLRVAEALESLMVSKAWYVPDFLVRLQGDYLRSVPHDVLHDARFLVAQGLQAFIESRSDQLEIHLRSLEALNPEKLKDPDVFQKICNILELSRNTMDRALVDRLFARMRPEDEYSEAMVIWLVTYSSMQRSADRDLNAAMRTLEKAQEIIASQSFQQKVCATACDYRYAVCLADAGRHAETLPYLERCIESMQKNGSAEDSATMMTTRGTYAVMLTFNGQPQKALHEFNRLAAQYRKQKRTHTVEYAILCNNTALALDQLGRAQNACDAEMEAIMTDQLIKVSPAIEGTHFRNAAKYFGHAGNPSEALALIQRARSIRAAAFGEDSGLVADCDAVRAEQLIALGRVEEGRELLEKAVSIMREKVAPQNRMLVSAQNLLDSLS